MESKGDSTPADKWGLRSLDTGLIYTRGTYLEQALELLVATGVPTRYELVRCVLGTWLSAHDLQILPGPAMPAPSCCIDCQIAQSHRCARSAPPREHLA